MVLSLLILHRALIICLFEEEKKNIQTDLDISHSKMISKRRMQKKKMNLKMNLNRTGQRIYNDDIHFRGTFVTFNSLHIWYLV